MKLLVSIPILFLLSSFAISGQNSLDSLVFRKINLYRTGLRLSELSWSDTIYYGAKHHTDYQYYFNRKDIDDAIDKGSVLAQFKSGHDEDISLKEIEKETFETRAHKYHFDEECVTMFTGNMVLRDEIVAEWIVKSWEFSPLHNKILTDPHAKLGAVSCKTVLIADVPEDEKKDNLKYGRDNKGIIYLSSTFNCKK